MCLDSPADRPCASYVQVRSIAELVLAQTAARLAQREIGLEVTEATMLHICEEGYDQVELLCLLLD